MSHDGSSVGPTTTEWDDALAKHGIIPKKEKQVTQDEIDTHIRWIVDEHEQNIENKLKGKTLEELDELEDEVDETILEEYRQKRLNELKEKAKGDKFGYIKEIHKSDYLKEVTESSKDQIVILCLYVASQEESKIMLKCLDILAQKFKNVKFLKIIGSLCIPDYPDSYCPTVIIYKDGDTVGNIKGLFPFGGKNVINADIVEWELAQINIWKTDLEENPRKFNMKHMAKSTKKYNSNDNDDDDDDNDDNNDNDDDNNDGLDLD